MTKGSKYYDSAAAIQVIGSALAQPSFLDQDGEYFFNEEDFINDFHKVMFGAIFNSYSMGTSRFNAKVIEDYLQNKEKSLAIYKANNGAAWIDKVLSEVDIINFDYYYNRLKKMTLLRNYDKIGVKLDWLYDTDNIIDLEKKEKQNKYLDSLSLEEVADLIDDRILDVRETYVDNSSHQAIKIGDTARETLEQLKETPAWGAPMFDPITSTVFMGARRGKFYIRSAATGVGKSRSMMADACYLACREIYDGQEGKWVSTGCYESTLFISVELDVEELQTLALAFIAQIPEDRILSNQMSNSEKERLEKAIQILEESNLFIEWLPDYGIKDVENSIKRNIRKNKVKYVFFDYICTSVKILNEIAQQSRGMKIREDNVLYLLSSKLKDIASIYDVCIISATQLNGSFKTEKIADQNMLSGAKAIANRVDVGAIMLDLTPDDLEQIMPVIEAYGLPIPNVKMSVYKNRRGKYNRVLLWMCADKSTCRYKTVFVTNYSNEIIDNVPATRIELN